MTPDTGPRPDPGAGDPAGPVAGPCSGRPPAAPRVRPVGDSALLVETEGPEEAAALCRALREAAPGGVEELVPAARTLLVRFDRHATGPRAVAAWIAEVRASRPVSGACGASEVSGASGASDVSGPSGADAVPPVEIPVEYTGADLDDVARRSGLTAAEVVAAHTGVLYTVAFFGFAPGFAYLTGLDPVLRMPRLDTPRTRVPAGSVAIAGAHTAVYPRESPGGWRLLGRTRFPVWDLGAEPPTPLTPGGRVRFRAVEPR